MLFVNIGWDMIMYLLSNHGLLAELRWSKNKLTDPLDIFKKNPACGRHRISQPMLLVAPHDLVFHLHPHLHLHLHLHDLLPSWSWVIPCQNKEKKGQRQKNNIFMEKIWKNIGYLYGFCHFWHQFGFRDRFGIFF